MKYIIDIKPEYEDSFKGVMILGAKDSNLFVDTLAVEELEELNSDYINEHYGDLQDTAYQKGLEEGKQTAVGAAELREKLEYQRGLNDAWEAARKIIRMPEGNILDLFPDCYASVCTAVQAILKYDTSEAIAKLKAYEEKQKAEDKIVVGDEVEVLKTGSKYLIAWISGTIICGFSYAGITCRLQPSDVRKTGRHFDIDKILEEMRND